MKNLHLIVLLIALSFISLSVGASNINLLSILYEYDEAALIMLTSRIPRLISLIIASISLSISGLIFQQISRNKFVSPSTASTLDGAKFGLAVAFAFFGGTSLLTKTLISFTFSLASTSVFMAITRRIRSKGAVYIPLIGLMLGTFLNSTTVFISYHFDIIQSITAWFYGDFSKVIKGRYEMLYLTLPLVVLTYLYINKFTIVSMGRDFSSNLGISYNRVVNLGLIIISLLSATTVIIVGNIPFVGLIIPNIVSLYMGDNLKKNIVKVSLIAPIFLIASDILGRVVRYPYELPIGLVVGVLGSVIFLYLIGREQI